MESDELGSVRMIPAELLARSVRCGREVGWRADDIFFVLAAAADVGLVCLGGQPQFRFPDGTCELYWLNFDPATAESNEEPDVAARRSNAEVAAGLRHIFSTTDLVAEGYQRFSFLRDKSNSGVDLASHLVFVVYFASVSEI